MVSVIELRGREHEATVEALLAAAQIHRAPEEAMELAPGIAREYTEPGALRLFGIVRNGHVLAVVGAEELGDGAVVVRDLAVIPAERRHGFGRALLDFLRSGAGYRSLEGHTLAGVTDFYARCGFAISEDGALPDGRTRYRFSWRAWPSRA